MAKTSYEKVLEKQQKEQKKLQEKHKLESVLLRL